MEARRLGKSRNSCVGAFSGKIKCGDCGSWYGSKVWHSNDKYRKVVWQCNHKFDGRKKCTTPHLDEEAIKKLFIKALNIFCVEREEITTAFQEIGETAFCTDELDGEKKYLQEEMNVVGELVQQCIGENSCTVQGQADYEKHYNALAERFYKAKARLDETEDRIATKQAQRKMMQNLVDILEKMPEAVDSFDEGAWYALVDYVTVYGRDDIRFTFKNGIEIAL